MNGADATARRALFVCEDPPIDGLSGAATYNHAIFRALRQSGYAIDLIVTTPRLQNLDAVGHVDPGARRIDYLHARVSGGVLKAVTLPAMLRRVKHGLLDLTGKRGSAAAGVAHFGRWLEESELRQIARLTRDARYDLIAVSTIFESAVLDVLPAGGHRMLIAHDIFFERTRSFAANGFEVGTAISEADEIAAWRRFDSVIAINPVDRGTIARRIDRPVATILPVIEGERAAATASGAARRILYLGTAAYHNVDGLRWLLDEVWPRVIAARPDVRLAVAGNIKFAFPEGAPGVDFLGRVDDLSALAGDCAFSINPLRMGSGIKIKMVDYFRLGLACVVTAEGAHGFPDSPAPPFAIVDNPEAFARTIVEWLGSDAPRHFAGRIDDYMRQFSLAAAVAAIAGLRGRD